MIFFFFRQSLGPVDVDTVELRGVNHLNGSMGMCGPQDAPFCTSPAVLCTLQFFVPCNCNMLQTAVLEGPCFDYISPKSSSSGITRHFRLKGQAGARAFDRRAKKYVF